MIERHADTPFAGGAVVFPGGRIEASDASDEWRAHCAGSDDIPPEEFGPRVAAIREAFEETGVLLARRNGAMITNDEAAAVDTQRKAVEDDDSLFLELVQTNGLQLALDTLHLYARWEPPLRGHENMRRYHTWFFAAQTPAGQEAREDGNEATEVLWTSPRDVIAACDREERKAIFPTRRNLELLTLSSSTQEVFDFAGKRKIGLVMPEIVERDGAKFLTIPDDMGYPVTEEALATAFRS